MTEENFKISININKLPGALVQTGRSGRRAVVMYVDETEGMVEKDGTVYLNLTAIKTKNSNYGDTHFIVPHTPDKPKTERSTIIGNIKPFQTYTPNKNEKKFNFDDDVPF